MRQTCLQQCSLRASSRDLSSNSISVMVAQATGLSNSSPLVESATALAADARSPALKAISNLAIQLKAVDNSISNVSADTPQGRAQTAALLSTRSRHPSDDVVATLAPGSFLLAS